MSQNMIKLNLLDHNSKRELQPSRIKLYLKEHQKAVLYQAQILENREPISVSDEIQIISQFGVIADKVGAGKSLDILSVIANRPSLSENLSYKTLDDDKQVKVYGNSELSKLNSNILVVPHSIVQQWEGYIKKYTELNSFVVNKIVNLRKIVKGRTIDGEEEEDEIEETNDLSNETVNNQEENIVNKKENLSNSKRKVRKMNTYQMFLAEKSKEIRGSDDGKNMKAKEVFAKCAEIWGSMDEISKMEWKEKSEIENMMREVKDYIIDWGLPETALQNYVYKKCKIDKEVIDNDPNILASTLVTMWLSLTSFEQDNYKCLELGNTPSKKNKIQSKQKRVSGTRDTQYYKLLDKYYNKQSDRDEELAKYGNLNKEKVEEYDIILVSSTFYNELAFYIKKDNYFVNRVIFDEADSIKISGALQIPGLFYWFITSSVKTLLNPNGSYRWETQQSTNYYGQIVNKQVRVKEGAIMSTGFIKDTFESIETNEYNHFIFIKNDDSFVEGSFKLPDPVIMVIKCQDNLQIKVLRGIVGADVIQMLNAGDLEGALDRVNCETVSESNIISAVTKKLEQDLDNLYIKLEMKKKMEYSTPKAKEDAIERSNKRIEEVKFKIDSIKERVSNAEFCEICYDDISNPAVTKCCQNIFCFECLVMALSSVNSCPKCRSSLTIEQLILIRDKKEELVEIESEVKVLTPKGVYEDKIEKMKLNSEQNDKYKNLEEILSLRKEYLGSLSREEKVKFKILIFSEYDNSFNSKVIKILDNLSLSYGRIKGNSMIINKVLKEYKEGDLNVLLVNSRYFGSGINLENTSDIVIMHRMGGDLQKQVIGRAQRLGRTFPLHIWKLYNINESDD